MSTKSFTNTYIIESSDVARFCEIMNKEQKIDIDVKVVNRELTGKEAVKFLGLDKK